MAERHLGRLYFASSRRFFVQVTELFDFIWPTAAAMWNLRWQVAGFVSVNPSAPIEELEGRFVAGSGIHGANLRRSCIDHSWSQQQGEFAKLLLVNIIALYEAWLKDALKAVGSANDSIERQLQRPTEIRKGKPYGVAPAIQATTAPESPILKANFYAALLGHRKNRLPYIENLFIVYLFFKECRNCIMHAGGLANDRTCDAYADLLQISTAFDLGASEIPVHEPIAIGQPVTILLRGVVGLCDVMLGIVATLDAELSRAKNAERELLERWAARYGKYTLSSTSKERSNAQVSRLISNLGFPRPTNPTAMIAFLRDHSLAW
jgi:hypothetical protein